MSEKQELPNSTLTLVLGILSIFLGFGFGLMGIALGIITLVISSEPKRMYLANPDKYTGYSNIKTGRTCAIVGLSLSAVVIVIAIVVVVLIIMGGASAVKPYEYKMY